MKTSILCFINVACSAVFAWVYYDLARSLKRVPLEIPEIAGMTDWAALAELCSYGFGAGVVGAGLGLYVGVKELRTVRTA
jgi:hypothetical protein